MNRHQDTSILAVEGYAFRRVKIVISGLTLNLTCHKCPRARLMYNVLLSFNSIFPAEYFLFFTGSIGGGRNGGLHCPP
jgi:hypothetical protein